MTECRFMGTVDEPRDGFRTWTDMFFVEEFDPETKEPLHVGEAGMLVVTLLRSNNATMFVPWSSGDIVINQGYDDGDGEGPNSVFSRIRHAHRTAGFFKVRGVNINHSGFEDFIFGYEQVQDFKAEVVTVKDLDRPRLSLELNRGADDAWFRKEVAAATKTTFEVSPEIQFLEHGTLANEFEGPQRRLVSRIGGHNSSRHCHPWTHPDCQEISDLRPG